VKTSFFLPPELMHADAARSGEALIAIARAAEAAGFDACNLTDHPAPTAQWRRSGGHDAFDPFAALCFIAAATSKLLLHTHIVVLPYRNPLITAKALATLDVLSGGRAIFGIGAGYMKGEYAALGVDFATRGQAMDEAIAVMKLAWSGEAVTYRGSNFTAEGILPQPIPLQRPHPPIWGGGNASAAISRAAELCDGWSPFFVAPEQALENATSALVTLADLRRLAGRYFEERARFGRSGACDICVNPPNRPQTRDAAARRIFLDQAEEMAEIGVTWNLVSLPGRTVAELLDSIAWFGEEVQPELHRL
jgi:probable F420-dependent oxidoreductase